MWVEQGWSAFTHAQLQGQILWQPNIMSIFKGEEPKWTRLIDIALYNVSNIVSFGDSVQVMIRHPKGTKISYIRLGAKAISFTEEDAEHTITEPVAVSPDMLFHGSHIAELCFTLGVRKDSDAARISRALSIAIVGAAMLSRQGWTVLQADMALTVEQAKTIPVQIFRPNIKRWALLEGDIWTGRPHHTPHPLGSLAGLGAPIRLRQGPYNAIEKDIPLVQEVVDSGVIAGIDSNEEILSIHFVRPIELDEKHQVIIWHGNGTLHIYGQENTVFEIQDSSWSLQLSPSVSQPLVVAIAYEGIRLGAWWHSTWCSILQQKAAQDPRTVAALLRWFQLPLLSDRWLAQIQQFACQYGGSVLPMWVSSDDTSPIEGMHWSPVDDRWLSAIRTLFKNWRPGDMASRKVVRQLGGTSEALEELLLKTAWRLLRVDPLLMGKIVYLYARNVCLPQIGSSSTCKLMQAIIGSFAESISNCNGADLQQKKSLLLKEVSSTMNYIDENFIKRGLIEPALQSFRGKSLSVLNENNIALALNIEPFRRLLSIRILETIEQIISSGR